MKKLLFFLMFASLICHANGQSKYDMVMYYFIDTAALYGEVREAVQKCENLNGCSGIRIFPIYVFDDFSPHSRQDYLDGTFLRNLSPRYYRKDELLQKLGIKKKGKDHGFCDTNSRLLVAVDEFLLTDNHGDFVAQVESGLFRVYQSSPSTDSVLCISPKTFMTNLLNTHDFDFVFRTSRFVHLYKKPTVYFGVNKQEERISVIIHTLYGCKVFPMEEIVSCHWEDFQNQLTVLKQKVNDELKLSFEDEMDNITYKFCWPFF